jgi:hypothetical protein
LNSQNFAVTVKSLVELSSLLVDLLCGVLQGQDEISVVGSKRRSFDSQGFLVAFHGLVFVTTLQMDSSNVVENDGDIAMRVSKKHPLYSQTLQETLHCHLVKPKFEQCIKHLARENQEV